MEVRDAIRMRRAVREYSDKEVSEDIVRELIEEAIQAPSAMNVQPWCFVVIQDRELLRRLSDLAKEEAEASHFRGMDMLEDPDFDIFYGAGTLILICAHDRGAHPEWDCCLAGENLMLAGREMGLGTCVIGLSWHVFELQEVRKKLAIPDDCSPVLPIIVGYPKEFPPTHGRKPAEIVCWKPDKVLAGV